MNNDENTNIKPNHEAANAFWEHWERWSEIEGTRDATLGAINEALKVAGHEPMFFG